MDLRNKNKRYYRLQLFRRLSSILSKPPHRFQDPESRLTAFARDGCHLKESRFKNALFAVYRFDSELSSLLSALYRCLPGAEVQAVDYRYFLCGIHLYSQTSMIRSKPLEFLFHLLRVFEHMNGKIQIDKILYTISCAAIHDEEVRATAGALSNTLRSTEIGCHAKSDSCWVQFPDMLIEALKINPYVLRAFTSTVSLNVLAPEIHCRDINVETKIEVGNTCKSPTYGIHEQRALMCHLRNLQRRHFSAWVEFVILKKKSLRYMARMSEEVVRIHIRYWKKWVEKRVRLRIMQRRTVRLGRMAIMKRSWAQLHQQAHIQQTLIKASWKHTIQGKKKIQASAAFRCLINKRKAHESLRIWRDTAMGMLAWDIAVTFSDKRFKVKIIHAWKKCAELTILVQKSEADAAERATALHSALMEAQVQKEMLVNAKRSATMQKKADTKAAMMLNRKENVLEQRMLENLLQKDNSLAVPRHILDMQAHERMQYKATQLAEMKRAHEQEWTIRIEEACMLGVQSMRHPLCLSNDNGQRKVSKAKKLSPEARNALDKEIGHIRRLLKAPPTSENATKEMELQNPMNAVVAYIKTRLYKLQMTLQKFFEGHEGFQGGFIQSITFTQLVKSLGLDLTIEQVQCILAQMDPKKTGVVQRESILETIKRSEELCGFTRSPWMIYVHPEEDLMVLHNIVLNKMIWDYKAKDSDLVRVAQDNILGAEWERCLQVALEEKLKDWENKLQGKAAKSIQHMFWAWKGRKARTHYKWVWETRKLREQNISLNVAAVSLQCWWRRVLAIKEASSILQLCVEKLVDPASLQAYYFNHSSKQAEWSKPLLLQRFSPDLVNPSRNQGDTDIDIDDPVPEWVSIVRENGDIYFLNTLSGIVEDNVPLGYIRCEQCRLQLARRYCPVERQRLCVQCFREQHTSSPGAWKHHWKTLQVYICEVCNHRVADWSCESCSQRLFCGPCWERDHAYSDSLSPLEHKKTNVFELFED